MRIRVFVAALVAAVLVATAAPASGATKGTLRAGAAAADITPPIGTPMFAYTARSAIAGGHVDRPLQVVADPEPGLLAKSFVASEGIHQRVKARAIVLEQDGEKYALVQADLGGVPYALTHEVANRIRSTGITEERILLSATHTHSSTGPIWPADNGGYAALGGDLFDPRVFELTAQGVTEAIVAADEDLRAARLGVGTVKLIGASSNRNIDPYRLNPDVDREAREDEEGAIDPELSVVRVDDSKGRPIGVWSNFAVHATSFGDGNLLFSGDNPGVTEELVETELSRRAPGREVINVWSNGNEGDIAPRGAADVIGGEPAQYVVNDFTEAHNTGRRVADGVLRAWEAAGEQMTAAPSLGARMTYLAFDGTEADGERVGPLAVLGAGVSQEGFCAPVDDMAGPGQGKKFPAVAGAGLVPNIHPVSMWKLGRLGVVALPSEVTKQMGTRIRGALSEQAAGAFDRVALAGLANSYVSYTATPEEYDACHYEGAFTLFGRRQGARFLDAARTVNAALLSGAAAPAGTAPPALGAGVQDGPPARETPDAGAVLEQPEPAVARFGRAVFRWAGGDPLVDAPRGADFVTVQRRTGSGWQTFMTDASFRDKTERSPSRECLADSVHVDPPDVGVDPSCAQGHGTEASEPAPDDDYVETVQFTECDPLATYRIVVTGRADRGDGVEPYTVASEPFDLRPLKLAADAPTVSGGVATVRARYPSPGAGALMALPRLVRSGEATFRVGGKLREVRADPATATFSVPVRDGQSVELVGVRDGCGNTT